MVGLLNGYASSASPSFVVRCLLLVACCLLIVAYCLLPVSCVCLYLLVAQFSLFACRCCCCRCFCFCTVYRKSGVATGFREGPPRSKAYFSWAPSSSYLSISSTSVSLSVPPRTAAFAFTDHIDDARSPLPSSHSLSFWSSALSHRIFSKNLVFQESGGWAARVGGCSACLSI